MQYHWDKIQAQLDKHKVNGLIGLNTGASEEQLISLEKSINLSLPDDFKSFYRVHDGQHGGFGMFFGLEFLSIGSIEEEWNSWNEIIDMNNDSDFIESAGSEPAGFIKHLYVNPKWIPFTHDQSGNHIGLDFDPDSKGRAGQIITFGRDDLVKIVKASSFADFIEKYIHELSSLNWTIDESEGWIINDKGFNGHYHEWYTERAVDSDEPEGELTFPGETMSVSVFHGLPVNYIPDSEEEAFWHSLEGKVKLDKKKIELLLSLNISKPINKTHYSIIEEVVSDLRGYRQRSLQFLLDEIESEKSEYIKKFIQRCQDECELSKDEMKNSINLREIEFSPQYSTHLRFTFGFQKKCDLIALIDLDADDQFSFPASFSEIMKNHFKLKGVE